MPLFGGFLWTGSNRYPWKTERVGFVALNKFSTEGKRVYVLLLPSIAQPAQRLIFHILKFSEAQLIEHLINTSFECHLPENKMKNAYLKCKIIVQLAHFMKLEQVKNKVMLVLILFFSGSIFEVQVICDTN